MKGLLRASILMRRRVLDLRNGSLTLVVRPLWQAGLYEEVYEMNINGPRQWLEIQVENASEIANSSVQREGKKAGSRPESKP